LRLREILVPRHRVLSCQWNAQYLQSSLKVDRKAAGQNVCPLRQGLKETISVVLFLNYLPVMAF
jgi:hypothetical protein